MTQRFPAGLIRCIVTSLAKSLKAIGEGERTRIGTRETTLRTLGKWKVKKESGHWGAEPLSKVRQRRQKAEGHRRR